MNKLSGFVQGFQPGLQGAADLLSSFFMKKYQDDRQWDRYIKREEEQERIRDEREQKKADFENQQTSKAQQIFNKLINGGEYHDSLTIDPATGGNKYYMPYDDKEKASLITQIPGLTVNEKLNAVEKLWKEKQPDWQYDYNKDQPFVFEKNRLTGEMRQTRTPNPYFIDDVVASQTGHDEEGRGVIYQKFRSGKVQRIYTGINNKGKNDAETTKKAMDHFTNQYNMVETKKKELSDRIQGRTSAYLKWKQSPSRLKDDTYIPPQSFEGDEHIKSQINALNNANESAIKLMMNDTQTEFINDYYNEIRNISQDIDSFEKENQEEIKQQFQAGVWEAKKDKRLSYDEARLLIQWSNFKHGYVR